jgi:ABC-type dipeptide/oligopeptide/nickel transport system permease component
MSTYIIKRLLLMIPTLIGITFITYVIIRSAPGTPTAMKGDLERGPQRQTLTAGDQGDYKKLLHLDKPAAVAYFYWVRDFFKPDANVSAKYKVFVFDVILQRLPNTLTLNLCAVVLLYLIGIPLGIDSAVNSRTIRERVITILLFFMYSLPSFWLGLNLIVWLGRGGRISGPDSWLPAALTLVRWLLPSVIALFIALHFIRKTAVKSVRQSLLEGGTGNPGIVWATSIIGAAAWFGTIILVFSGIALLALTAANDLSFVEFGKMVFIGEISQAIVGLPIAGLEPENASRLSYLTLLRNSLPYYLMPVFCMTYAGLAGESRYMRVGMMEILRQDFVRTARSKGLQERQVIFRHVLPNALTPVVVGVAGIFPGMIGGSVIIETIFSVPGMGLLFFEAVQARDYNLVMAGSRLQSGHGRNFRRRRAGSVRNVVV